MKQDNGFELEACVVVVVVVVAARDESDGAYSFPLGLLFHCQVDIQAISPMSAVQNMGMSYTV